MNKNEVKPYLIIEEKHEKNEIHDKTAKFKEEYLVGKQIGQGAYANVRVALHKGSNSRVAIKIYEKSKIDDPQRRKSVSREIKVNFLCFFFIILYFSCIFYFFVIF